VAAGPHDDGNGKAKDEDDALTVPGFGSPALVAGASRGRCVVELGRHGAHRRVGSSMDNNFVPEFDEGEVPGFSNGSGGFGGKRKQE
jgi:hypothetical protein